MEAAMADRKAVIKNADMSEDMQQDAIDCATQALEKYNIEKDIAALIEKEFDKNMDKKLQRSEFYELLKEKRALDALDAVGVDALALADFADVIFEAPDCDDDSEPSISLTSFLEIVLELRGANTATVKDLVDYRKWSAHQFKNIMDASPLP